MELIRLKDETFYYCNKKYRQQRYISKDRKFYFTSDNGFNYTMAYKATSDRKAELIHGIYHKNNYSSYPHYTVESAIDRIKELGITTEFTLNVGASHYTTNNN